MMLMASKSRPGLKIMAAVLVCFAILIPGVAWATTQFPDILFLDGQKHFLESLPLEQYYGPDNPRPVFRWPNTATWRGYIATWEIINNVLYLKVHQGLDLPGGGGAGGLVSRPARSGARHLVYRAAQSPPRQNPQTRGAPAREQTIPHTDGGKGPGDQTGSY